VHRHCPLPPLLPRALAARASSAADPRSKPPPGCCLLIAAATAAAAVGWRAAYGRIYGVRARLQLAPAAANGPQLILPGSQVPVAAVLPQPCIRCTGPRISLRSSTRAAPGARSMGRQGLPCHARRARWRVAGRGAGTWRRRLLPPERVERRQPVQRHLGLLRSRPARGVVRAQPVQTAHTQGARAQPNPLAAWASIPWLPPALPAQAAAAAAAAPPHLEVVAAALPGVGVRDVGQQEQKVLGLLHLRAGVRGVVGPCRARRVGSALAASSHRLTRLTPVEPMCGCARSVPCRA
jgi:hypothetical protein